MKIKSYCFIWVLFLSTSINVWAGKRAMWVGEDFKGMACQGEEMGYGPYDYRDNFNRKNKLPIVEQHHFARDVQSLKKGMSGYLIDDIGYTLRAFPNHYKALNALIYYQILKQDLRPVNPAVECHFFRAFVFVPTDATVRMLYAVYLKKIRRFDLADQFYQKAIKLAPTELRFRYIYGLFLVKQKKYALAKEQALIVYKEKYPQQKLKHKLINTGYWK